MSTQNAPPTLPTGGADGVTVRFWAAARAAAGADTGIVAPGTLAGLIHEVSAKYPELSALLPRCAFLLDGVAVTREDAGSRTVSAGSTVEILPPFAGG